MAGCVPFESDCEDMRSPYASSGIRGPQMLESDDTSQESTIEEEEFWQMPQSPNSRHQQEDFDLQFSSVSNEFQFSLMSNEHQEFPITGTSQVNSNSTEFMSYTINSMQETTHRTSKSEIFDVDGVEEAINSMMALPVPEPPRSTNISDHPRTPDRCGAVLYNVPNASGGVTGVVLLLNTSASTAQLTGHRIAIPLIASAVPRQPAHPPPTTEFQGDASSAGHCDSPSTRCPLRHDEPTAVPSPAPAARPYRGASGRGAHVRGRPEMQRTAREGAAYWHRKLREVRAAWEARAAGSVDFHATFSAQAAAAQARVKCKQECLLRFLQMAAVDGLVRPSLAASPDEGFFGWAGLRVAEGRGAAFRAGLEALFADGFRENTVREGFRRAGLLPPWGGWNEAWAGKQPLLFQDRPAGPGPRDAA